jgi:septal ring factor EnvC (AmiA/AmiB activator)
MIAEIENLILEHLKIIQSELATISRRIDEIHQRTINVERMPARQATEMAHMQAEVISDRHRVDRIEQRLERIERRLELTD